VIFVTVGAQMPFDRLVRTVDDWAGRVRAEIFAQIGPSRLRPRHMAWTRFLAPGDFLAQVGAADLLVAHAGMGSIITALEYGKPLLIMPRRGELGETRNDHQVATAHRFRGLGWVDVAFDEQELVIRLDRFESRAPPHGPVALPCPHRSAGCPWAAVAPCAPHPGTACPHLLASLRDFIGASARSVGPPWPT
jgi:UDP-N-acetylglucosamine transferase subunit ALG13